MDTKLQELSSPESAITYWRNQREAEKRAEDILGGLAKACEVERAIDKKQIQNHS